MMCGSLEIDGYAFCLGLKSLKLSYIASPELQTLPLVTYLIERAGLRSKYTTNLLERFCNRLGRIKGITSYYKVQEELHKEEEERSSSSRPVRGP
jgi:hypothetical protein